MDNSDNSDVEIVEPCTGGREIVISDDENTAYRDRPRSDITYSRPVRKPAQIIDAIVSDFARVRKEHVKDIGTRNYPVGLALIDSRNMTDGDTIQVKQNVINKIRLELNVAIQTADNYKRFCEGEQADLAEAEAELKKP
jgi:hypothetical protein